MAGLAVAIDRYEAALEASSGDVILTGASHMAQYLALMSPVIGARALAVLDNAPAKQGRRLYGTDLPIHGFDFLASQSAPIVLVPPTAYAAELGEQVRRLNPLATVLG